MDFDGKPATVSSSGRGPAARHRDGLPGPGALRQPRRRRQPLPRPRAVPRPRARRGDDGEGVAGGCCASSAPRSRRCASRGEPVRRPAPDRRDRALAARRPQGRHARRADRRPRRRADRRGAQPRRAPARERPRRHPHQPQHVRRHGGRRPRHGAAARAATTARSTSARPAPRRSSPRSPAPRPTPSPSGPHAATRRRSSMSTTTRTEAHPRRVGGRRPDRRELPADLQDERLIALAGSVRLRFASSSPGCAAATSARCRSSSASSSSGPSSRASTRRLPLQPQPRQPHPAERSDRHHRPRHRARAAARRDRPVGRVGQRPVGRHPRPWAWSSNDWPLSWRSLAGLAGGRRHRPVLRCSLHAVRRPQLRHHPGRAARLPRAPAEGARRRRARSTSRSSPALVAVRAADLPARWRGLRGRASSWSRRTCLLRAALRTGAARRPACRPSPVVDIVVRSAFLPARAGRAHRRAQPRPRVSR